MCITNEQGKEEKKMNSLEEIVMEYNRKKEFIDTETTKITNGIRNYCKNELDSLEGEKKSLCGFISENWCVFRDDYEKFGLRIFGNNGVASDVQLTSNCLCELNIIPFSMLSINSTHLGIRETDRSIHWESNCVDYWCAVKKYVEYKVAEFKNAVHLLKRVAEFAISKQDSRMDSIVKSYKDVIENNTPKIEVLIRVSGKIH